MRLISIQPRVSLLCILSLFLLAGCNEEDAAPHPNEKVNTWIYEVMDEVYLWTNEMPSNVSKAQEPEDYFSDLLYSGDRFSTLVPDFDALINSLNGVTYEAGYEFTLAQAEGDDVVAIILYIKGNSPAEATDLQRGDVITHINGTKLTMANYRDVLDETESNHTVSFIRFDESIDGFVSQPDQAINTVVLAENPNFTHRVITSQTGRKVGYFVYNFFSSGATEASTDYDDEMQQVFASFKNEGVEEMVLDLRYNSGGSLTSAVKLASLVGKNIDESKIFSDNRWNDLYQDYIEGLSNGDSILRRRFVTLPENIGQNLSSGKIYVLTSPSTASASELVINGLMPFMDVHLIGEKTVGKNVGSVPIEDEENEDNPRGLLPIVLKTYNSLGQSNYDNGFNPGPQDQVSDIQFPMLPLGDIDEPLLARALEHIDGVSGRTAADDEKRMEAARMGMKNIGSSLDRKLRTNRLIID